ncbi:oligoribonuclease [Candidatus Saccharibacteria bacterium CG_4_10_14_0_2_um_filter_52_9]|nr:MAG: oligoribonuclease [Candidatus Saccharibacteria bacterium CG_4_10_14_0_2_um_filter_52_9]
MIDKKAVPTKLLWVDLEMTGLDAENDVILEVAAEVTDFEFKTIASYEAIVQQPRDIVVDRMQKNIWWADFPANRDEFVNKLDSGKPLGQVEKELIALVTEHFGAEAAVLAGNSIHNDRNFIKKWWPGLDLKLHYRMLDVSAWKVLMQAKYGVQFEKKEVHRAFDDIQASIAELQHYLEWFNHGSHGDGSQNS